MAKDIVRAKRNIRKMQVSQSKLRSVAFRLGEITSQIAIQNAMIVTTRALVSVNRTMPAKTLQSIMNRFERENMIMELNGDTISKTLEDIDDDDDEELLEEEENELVDQVLLEMGLELNKKLSTVKIPTLSSANKINHQKLSNKKSSSSSLLSTSSSFKEDDDSLLEKRLENLLSEKKN